MRIPGIVIAGAAKSGTTALSAALAEHPDIYIGDEKEPRFHCDMEATFTGPMSAGFNRTLITDANIYRAMFAAAGDRLTLDASTDYLADPKAASRIHEANPDARIIIGLRHPVTRAYSQHTHLLREGLETESFEHALAMEEARREKQWVPLFHHVGRSRYAAGLKAFLDTFGEDQVFVYMHETYIQDPASMLARLGDFLELATPLSEAGMHNQSGVPRSRIVNAVLRPQRFNFVINAARKAVPSKELRKRLRGSIDKVNLDRPDFPSPQAARYIIDQVTDDVREVEELLHMDLSDWLVVPG